MLKLTGVFIRYFVRFVVAHDLNIRNEFVGEKISSISSEMLWWTLVIVKVDGMKGNVKFLFYLKWNRICDEIFCEDFIE